ncbi:MAG: hypothetical protein IT179_05750 [Acidobacteria bacterium]|nr:hypothetical protein [Acidobacteriota bacterium]
MKRAHRVVSGAALAIALFYAPLVAGQEQGLGANDPQLSAERSWAVQNALAAIDRDREAAVNALIEGWVPYLDKAAYDPWSEIKPIAMKAPAWQLLGASLVGDYHTMVNILRGKVGAAKYVNALNQPQAKKWTPASPQVLGDTTAGLIFTPIPPCRIVDTRGTGARTGMLAVNTPRTFDLTTDGYTEGQGGQTSGCTGLPSFSHYGFSINITVVGFSGTGGLQVYPYSGSIPATSIINYFPGAGALANNGPVTGCYGCADDITINAFQAPTHVIIDVMGYFERGPYIGSSTSRVAGTPVAVAAGGRTFVYSGSCPAGTVLVAGENDFGGSDVAIGESRQDSIIPERWVMWMINNDGVSRTSTTYARCLDTPIEVP